MKKRIALGEGLSGITFPFVIPRVMLAWDSIAFICLSFLILEYLICYSSFAAFQAAQLQGHRISAQFWSLSQAEGDLPHAERLPWQPGSSHSFSHQVFSFNLSPGRRSTMGLVICVHLSTHLHCELCQHGASFQRLLLLGWDGTFVILVHFLWACMWSNVLQNNSKSSFIWLLVSGGTL